MCGEAPLRYESIEGRDGSDKRAGIDNRIEEMGTRLVKTLVFCRFSGCEEKGLVKLPFFGKLSEKGRSEADLGLFKGLQSFMLPASQRGVPAGWSG